MSSLFSAPRSSTPAATGSAQINTIQDAPRDQAVFFQGNPNDKDTMLTRSASATGAAAQAPANQNYVLFNGAWTPFESVVGTLRQPDQATQVLAADRLQSIMRTPEKPKLAYNTPNFGWGMPDTSRFIPNVGIPQGANPWERQRAILDAQRKGNLQYTYKPTTGDVLAASLAEDDPTRQAYLRSLQGQAVGWGGKFDPKAIQQDAKWRGLYEWALQNNPGVARLYEQAFGFSKPQPAVPIDQQWV